MNALLVRRVLSASAVLLTVSLALTTSAFAQNDECTGALPLPMGATAFDTSSATLSATAWPCAAGGGPDLWYTFTAPADGDFTVDTCAGTAYNTALELFTGTCAALVSVSCNDDTCGSLSEIAFSALMGDQFIIRVGGYNGFSGPGTLTVDQNLPMLNPANGHYYEIVSMNVDWGIADQTASAMTYLGMPGHLVTISDAAEDQFVYFTLAGGPLGNSWLGAYQDMTSPTFVEPDGGWTWVTGEPFSYTNWAAGEPNNGGGSEHYLGYWPADQWNDYTLVSANVATFVVEYETTDIGMTYCSPAVVNSTGAPGEIRASGSIDIATNAVSLTASSLPNNAFGFFLTSQTQGFVTNPGGSVGNLCLGGAIGRYVGPGQIQNTGGAGEISLVLDLTMVPQPTGFVAVQSGETWSFSAWHRDAMGGMAVSNFTDGVEITFQ